MKKPTFNNFCRSVLIIVALFSVMTLYNDTGEANEAAKMKIRIRVGNKVLTATMYDNATTRSFMNKLPLALFMMDRYGRELVYRFSEPLPAEETSTRGYEVGEIIYYPPLHSFVIMYAQNGERFNMQSMGHVDKDVHLLKGIGDTNVRFEVIKD